MKQNLTPLILAYKEGKIPKSSAVSAIAIFSYEFLQKKFKGDPDTASDIFCEIYRRIPKMIDSFVYRGSPFEIYLHMSIRRASCTFFSTSRRQRLLRDYSEKMYFDGLDSEPEDNSYIGTDDTIEAEYTQYFSLDENRKIQLEHLRRRLLCLICKNAYFCTSSHIMKAAAVTGVSYDWLSDKIEMLRKSMHCRSGRFFRLSLLRKENMARAHIYKNAADSCCVKEEQIHYRQRYNAARRRMKTLSTELHHVPLSPTHSEIARVLKIPKGSVDSGLHYLRTALLKTMENDGSS